MARKRKRETKVKEKRALSTEPWPLNAVSTRNCYHCLAPRDGVYVSCRMGYPMVGDYDRHKRRLSYNGVTTAPRLLKPCQGRDDFDNDWSQAAPRSAGEK